jgi:hypothetical protein
VKRFIIAAGVAVALGLGTAGTASAQYIIEYKRLTPNGGVVTTDSIYNFGSYQTSNTYVSPFGTVRQQAYGVNAFGNTFGAARGFNPWTGAAYNRGFYNPGPFVYPGLGYSYNFYRRW